ncbi:TPA: DUF551 domain-containing protein [Klebsiella variicola]|nr:DUF551 domain-containing protein [Klebsiella variicola]
MSTITKEQLIEDLKASTQNSRGMFEIGEETICALMSLLTTPPAPVFVPEWTNKQCLEFLSIAFRHAEIKGDLQLDDIRLGVKMVNGSRAAMLQGAEPVTTAYKLPANTPCKDAPEHIWFQTAGVWPESGEFSELTWCSDNQHPDDTLYVRADVFAGNSPVITDGWVACSERMPEDDDFVYIWPRPDFGVELHVGQYCECHPKGDGWYAQVYEQNYGIEWCPITVTHWMPLPAAPQQEA